MHGAHMKARCTAQWLAALMAAATVAIVCAGASTAANTRATQSDPPREDDRPLRVMSFNIRYDTAKDGDHGWRYRGIRVIEHLKKSDADFIGLQEVLPSQRQDLSKELLDFAMIGRSRETSPTEGEATPILFRRSQWALVPSRSGTFWLSETPGSPGSISWKAATPRIATWGVFQSLTSERRVLVLNTHLDHASQEAREEGARVIARFLAGESKDLPVIVLGDFNASASNPARRTLCEGVAGSPPLSDTYNERHPGPEHDAATFHGFKGGSTGPRIDAILVSRAFEVVDATIDRATIDGLFLSDHYPVIADLRWQRAAHTEPSASPTTPALPRSPAKSTESAPPGPRSPDSPTAPIPPSRSTEPEPGTR